MSAPSPNPTPITKAAIHGPPAVVASSASAGAVLARAMRTAICLLSMIVASAHADSPAQVVGAPGCRPSNIVLVMVDDLGLYDLGCYGFDAVDTPASDRLAAEGMRFTNAYAAAPVCSPSRAAVLTGQAPARLHLTNHISSQHFAPENPRLLNAPALTALPPEAETYAERLSTAGYVCGFFGKWHLSLTKPNARWRVTDPETLPDRQGFLVNFGGNGAGGPVSWFAPYKNPYLDDGPDGEYLPERLTEEAIAFMREHRDTPFLINFWNWTVHSPLETTTELTRKYEAKRRSGVRMTSPVYAGMIEAADRVLGRLLGALDELDLANDTLVVMTSDNGGVQGLTNRGPAALRKGKGFLYEGGLRIPMIVRWPGRVRPGATNGTPVTHTDFFPTFLEAACESAGGSQTLDGESLVPLLTGRGQPERDALYFHYPNYAFHTKNRLGGAVVQGGYKLLNWYDDDSVELYNLREDPSESQDLAAKEPRIAGRLKHSLRRWLQATNANMPVVSTGSD